MSTNENMIAYGKEVDEIAKELGADSLAYISLDGVYEAIRGERGEHCDACFTGEYPLADTDRATGKFALEELSPLPQVTNGNGKGAHEPVAALEPVAPART